jgi:hypothetical protein
MTEKIELSPRLLELWLEETIIHEQGYIIISNFGGSKAWINKGAYHVKKQGITTEIYCSKEKQLHIFKTLIRRYNHFERYGFFYAYDRGSWRKSVMNSIHDVRVF